MYVLWRNLALPLCIYVIMYLSSVRIPPNFNALVLNRAKIKHNNKRIYRK